MPKSDTPSPQWATQKQRRYIESCMNRRKDSLSFRRKHSVMKERKKMNRHMQKFQTPPSSIRRRHRLRKRASKIVWSIPNLVERIMELTGAKDLCSSVRLVSHHFKFLISVHPCVDPRTSFLANGKNVPSPSSMPVSMVGFNWFEELLSRKYDIKDLFAVVYFFIHSPVDRKIHEAVCKLPRDFTLNSHIFCVCLAALLSKLENGEVTLNDVVMAHAHGLHKLARKFLGKFCEVKRLDCRHGMSEQERARFRRMYREYAANLQLHGFRGCLYRHEFDEHVLGTVRDDRDLRRMAVSCDGFEWPNRYTPVAVIEPVQGCDWEQRCCGVDPILEVDPCCLSASGGDGSLMLLLFDMMFDRRNPFQRLSVSDIALRERILNAASHFCLAWGVKEAMSLWKYQTVVYREACLWMIIAPPLLQENVVRARKNALFLVGGIDAPMVDKDASMEKVLRMIRDALSWARMMGLHVEFDRLKAYVSRQLKIKTAMRMQLRTAICEFETNCCR